MYFIQPKNVDGYGYKLVEHVQSLKVPEKAALPLPR